MKPLSNFLPKTLSFRRNVSNSYLTATRINFLMLLSVKKKIHVFEWQSNPVSLWRGYKTPPSFPSKKRGRNNFNLKLNLIMRAERKKEKENETRDTVICS